MNDAFYNLAYTKQERIINAAMKEFVDNGFVKASTNNIVRHAGISKGSLFYYFQNKKDLYFFLIEHTRKDVKRVFDAIDYEETDLFKRLTQISFAKLDIQKNYPESFDFLTSVFTETSAEVKDEGHKKIEQIQKEGFEKLYINIDWSLFRPEIDVNRAVEILNWTMMGFAEKNRSRMKTFENVGPELMADWEAYAQILKTSFYHKTDEE
ncbi:TetR/AcrR family transcriptional regulator [Salisediminibacterium beveridgei]|uniref:Transcriptional regulator, TetR family n=1 Tax=Salisediminibacterium beveridgei TaxID=632773 RepID=A0A1D7QT43_9BACI|nr:TetR/AcrR family transcriptional regulator [Salisediminibacterium beveridgei]AOM82157.1 Transcriptional regulator, TetR family [Salisediminibacterium beveridgei]